MGRFSRLLRDARAGDEEALDLIYRRYWDPVRGAIHKRLSGSIRKAYETSDIAQSIFADLLRDLPKFRDRGETAFRHWLYIKAENKIRDKLRKDLGRKGDRQAARIDTGAPIPRPGPSLTTEIAEREESGRLFELVSDLDDEQRRILELRLDQGLRFAEIAESMGLVSADAARKRFSRSVESLRRSMVRPD